MRINEVKWVQVRANKVQKMCDTEANVTIFTHPCSPTELKPFFPWDVATGLVRRVLLLGEEEQSQLQRYGKGGLTGLAEQHTKYRNICTSNFQVNTSYLHQITLWLWKPLAYSGQCRAIHIIHWGAISAVHRFLGSVGTHSTTSSSS